MLYIAFKRKREDTTLPRQAAPGAYATASRRPRHDRICRKNGSMPFQDFFTFDGSMFGRRNRDWTMSAGFRRLVADESGATAIEYSLIAGLIFLAIVTSMFTLRDRVSGIYNTIGDEIGRASCRE